MAIRYEVEPPRATITIDDPERRNPLSTDAIAQLLEATQDAQTDERARVIVITGAGDRVFSAGADLKSGFVDQPEALHQARGVLADLFRTLRSGGKPTVARVNGHALAGGFGLAAACDIVVATEEARFGTPEINVGLWPMMVTAVLQRLMPRKALLELMMTGRLISAAEAKELGVVSRVVPASELDTAVDEIVAELAAKSPVVLEMGRRSFYDVEDLDLDQALDLLHQRLTEVAQTEDATEGVRAFLEKRDPRWKGR